MALEIERKFLVLNDHWRTLVSRQQKMSQGYLGSLPVGGEDHGRSSVRIRIAGDLAHLNIKSRTPGHTRLEFEYPIPVDDAEILLRECANHCIEKIRHWIPVDSLMIEVDEFLGSNEGLVVAEIELEAATQTLPALDWLGAEVTDDWKYYNTELAQRPWCLWSEEEQNEYSNA